MHSLLVLGSGKIGGVIARFLAETGDYAVRVGDTDVASLQRLRQTANVETIPLDAANPDALHAAMEGCSSVVSALSHLCNRAASQAALERGASYFDLTEDLDTAMRVRQLAEGARNGQIFMPQCGLAPGFISILAQHLTEAFDELDCVHLRVGALPRFPSNALNYNLTWSTDGLINEYCNPCEAIHEGRRIETLPLEGLEFFSLDGVRYEAFNTSGGLGTLCETLAGRVRELNYRTVRYVGHRDLMRFLISDLRLGSRREVLQDVLEKAIPITYQDVVVVFCTVAGSRGGQFVQTSDARRLYGRASEDGALSAIQATTAAGICAVLDLHYEGKLPKKGFVKQEDVNFDAFINNRFGRYYQTEWIPRYEPSSGGGSGDDDHVVQSGAWSSRPA